MADSGDTRRVGLGFAGDAGSRFATTGGAVRTDAAFGAGAPIVTSSTASGSAAKTAHGGSGRSPTAARKNVNQAMCNKTDVIIATTSSDTGHERVAVTACVRGACPDVGSVLMSAGCGIVSAGGALSPRPDIRTRQSGSARPSPDGVGGASGRCGVAPTRSAHLRRYRM